MNEGKMLIAKAKGKIELYEAIQKVKGGQFNIFSILNCERLEVSTHSAFIYELLNPRGSHAQGILYLKAFLKDVLHKPNFNLNAVKVERERSIGEAGRLDLVIENNEELLIIEMKIDAGDQPEQLKRYDAYGKNSQKNYEIFYLTLLGNEASEDSAGEGDEQVAYKCVSFKTEIINWIERCIQLGQTPTMPIIRETLIQYKALLEKLTGQIEEGLMMTLTQVLLEENNLAIADKLLKAIPYAKATLEYKFWKAYYETYHEEIEKLGLVYTEDHFFDQTEEECIEQIVNIRQKRKGDFYFEYKVSEEEEQAVYLWIGESGYDETIYMSLGIIKGEEVIPQSKWESSLIEKVEALGFNKSGDNKYCYVQTKLNFLDESLYRLQETESFNAILQAIGEEIVKKVKQLVNSHLCNY